MALQHFGRIGVHVLATLACLYASLAILLPRTLAANLSASAARLLIVWFIGCVLGAFAEYGIHRFPFHERMRPFGYMQRMHLKHHITWHDELETLPWYWFALLCALATPLIVLAQYVASKAPVVLGGYLATATSYLVFEFAHYWAHTRPDSAIGKQHLKHHRDARCNFSMAGLFGIPLDRLFGTAR